MTTNQKDSWFLSSADIYYFLLEMKNKNQLTLQNITWLYKGEGWYLLKRSSPLHLFEPVLS